MELIEKEVSIGEQRVKVSLLETKNAVICLFYEGEPQIGTLSVAIPSLEQREISISSILLGNKNTTISRILAENISKKYGKMVLVSTSFKNEEDPEIREMLSKLLKQIMTQYVAR